MTTKQDDRSVRPRSMSLSTHSSSTRRVTARRRRASPAQSSFDFSLPPTVLRQEHAWTVRVATRAVWTHLLYSRGVLPLPVAEIIACNSTETKRGIKKCASQVAQLLNEWDKLMQQTQALGCSVLATLITLGPTWARPREQHLLNFSGLTRKGEKEDENGENAPPTSDKLEHALSRRLVSSLLNAANSDEEDVAALSEFLFKPAMGACSFQVHVSVLFSKHDAQRLFEGQQDLKLVTRHGFRVMNKDGHKQAALIQTNIIGTTSVPLEEDSGIWMTLPTAVKGCPSSTR